MVAAQNGHLKVVEMLIASKANVNHQNNVSCLWLVYVHVTYELISSMQYVLYIVDCMYCQWCCG